MSRTAISQSLGGGIGQYQEPARLQRRLLRPRVRAQLAESAQLARGIAGSRALALAAAGTSGANTGPTVQMFSRRHAVVLTAEDQRVIARALLDPPPIGPRLREAIERYGKVMR